MATEIIEEVTSKTANPHIIEATAYLIIAGTSGSGGMDSAGMFVRGINYANTASRARKEMRALEIQAEINVLRDTHSYRPSEQMKEAISNADALINQTALDLAVPLEQVCYLRSYEGKLPKLDDACLLVSSSKPLEEAQRAYLVHTNYGDLLPFKSADEQREFTQPMVGFFGFVFCGAVAVVSFCEFVRKANKITYLQK